MLVFLSDLHFTDATAGEHNLSARAFRVFFQDLAGLCKWLEAKGNQVKEIKLVFLGDVFDLLRTEAWFEVPLKERPWGVDEKATEVHANKIFDAIRAKNKAVFDLLSAPLAPVFDLPIEPERIYVPGNHDRLCQKYPSLRKKVREQLRIDPPRKDPFNPFFLSEEYAVMARHGHEFDVFNYEGSSAFTLEDYLQVPIGDPITTELVSKISWKIMQHKEVQTLPEEEKDSLKRNLQNIENVRPLSATILWLLYQVRENARLKYVIEECVDEVIEEFNEIPYVKKWYDHHDKWTEFLDEADKIQAVLFLLKKIRVFSLEKVLNLYQKIEKMFKHDEMISAASQEFLALGPEFHYVVYGHTHQPKNVALRVIHRLDEKISKQIYLNTGTWRTRYYKCTDSLDFIGWKNMTYVVLYLPEERSKDIPTFETWTGAII